METFGKLLWFFRLFVSFSDRSLASHFFLLVLQFAAIRQLDDFLTHGLSVQAWSGVFSLTKASFLGSMPFYVRIQQGLCHL